MTRPKKCRRVRFIPDNHYFYPEQHSNEEVNIRFEEVEAIRLSDLEGMEQSAAAEEMNISRGTFQRIINTARQKVADALVNGKVLRIEGGDYEFTGDTSVCMGRCRRHRGGRN